MRLALVAKQPEIWNLENDRIDLEEEDEFHILFAFTMHDREENVLLDGDAAAISAETCPEISQVASDELKDCDGATILTITFVRLHLKQIQIRIGLAEIWQR